MLILIVPLAIPLLIIIGIVCFIKRLRVASLLFIISALCLNYYTQSYPLNINSTDKGKSSHLRVMTYNIGLHNPLLGKAGQDLDDFMSFIRQRQPNILVLPEGRMYGKPALHDSLCQVYSYNSSQGYKSGGRYIETWVYSHYPITNVSRLGQCYAYSMNIELTDSQQLCLLACHLSSNQNNSSLNQGGIWNNISTGYQQRRQEVEIICDTLQNIDRPLLLCGDLNDISGSNTLNTLQQRLSLNDAWWQKGFGYGCTFTGKHLYFRLDHILASHHLEIVSVEVPSLNYSDHYPVIADYDLYPTK